MATDDSSPNKSAFLRALFQKNPNLREADASEAWQKAGYEGTIGTSLFYNVKSALRKKSEGGAGGAMPRKRGRPPGRKGPRPVRLGDEIRGGFSAESGSLVSARWSRTSDRDQVLDGVEDGIDDLIVELKQLGGMDEALEALRKVRRLVVRSYED
jgi:hypothetical protein